VKPELLDKRVESERRIALNFHVHVRMNWWCDSMQSGAAKSDTGDVHWPNASNRPKLAIGKSNAYSYWGFSRA